MDLIDNILKGERAAIAKAITIVESSKDSDQQISRQMISELIKKPGKSITFSADSIMLEPGPKMADTLFLYRNS